MFKGTAAYPHRVVDRAISRVGGYWNAFTSLDLTAYVETLPAEEICLGLSVESDRMVNCLFSPEEVAAERGVIISERQGLENSPTFLLTEAVQAAAFRVHPYRHQVIGDIADLKIISRDDLHAHYQTYYRPNNAIVAAVGDFDADGMLGQIAESFGPIASGPEQPEVGQAEPNQRRERRVTVRGGGSTAYLMLAYRAPSVADPDFFSLSVLGAALVGGGTGPLGDGGTNRSSRLYKALVETELASGVSGGLRSTIDPFLYEIRATVRSGGSLQELEAAVDAELERLLTSKPVTLAELVTATKRAKAAFAYSSESVTNQGYWLGTSELAAGSHRWFHEYLDRLGRVTVDDVALAGSKWLNRQRRTVGWYVPESGW